MFQEQFYYWFRYNPTVVFQIDASDGLGCQAGLSVQQSMIWYNNTLFIQQQQYQLHQDNISGARTNTFHRFNSISTSNSFNRCFSMVQALLGCLSIYQQQYQLSSYLSIAVSYSSLIQIQIVFMVNTKPFNSAQSVPASFAQTSQLSSYNFHFILSDSSTVVSVGSSINQWSHYQLVLDQLSISLPTLTLLGLVFLR